METFVYIGLISYILSTLAFVCCRLLSPGEYTWALVGFHTANLSDWATENIHQVD